MSDRAYRGLILDFGAVLTTRMELNNQEITAFASHTPLALPR